MAGVGESNRSASTQQFCLRPGYRLHDRCRSIQRGPISGGAINPAVGFGATLGSALFASGGWSDLWIYFVGPLLGAAIGAGIHSLQVGEKAG